MARFSFERAAQAKIPCGGVTLTALTTAFSLSMGLLWVTPERLSAQVVDLTIRDVGIAIGDKPVMTGVRLNFRDRNLVRVTGVNATIWNPYEPAHGVVNGLALGVPMTGAATFNGAATGLFGVGAQRSITGIGVGGIGVGGGGTLRGVAIGGIGVGAPMIRGLAVGGLGVGGVDVHAIAISGAYFRIGDNGRFDGGAFAPVTDVRGQQHGITIGLFNYARELHGAQIGVINVSDNGGARRILPLVAIR